MPASLDPAIIKGLSIFDGLDDAARTEVLVSAISKRYPAGHPVFEQGEVAAHFFALLFGRLRVTQVTTEGQQVIVRMVNPGDLFGIAKALRRPDYPGTATAVTESLAVAWPMEAWDPLIRRFPTIAIAAMQTMGNRLQEAHTRLRELSTEEVERRVAHAVLRLAAQAGSKEARGIRIDFPISRQDIAEMTGTTLHTVSRILSAWESAGLVEGGRQKLVVRDPHALVLIGDGLRKGLL